MQRLYFLKWLKDLPNPSNIAATTSEATRFKRLAGTEAFERAVFFHRIEQAVKDAGVYNPYEPFSLTYEAFHPYSVEGLKKAIEGTNLGQDVSDELLAAGYSVLCRDLYFSTFDFDVFSTLAPPIDPSLKDIIVDPYYGVIPIKIDGQSRLLHLVRDQWELLLGRLKREFPADPLPQIDDQFSQGLTFGQTGIGDALGERIGDAYRAGHIPDVIVANKREFDFLIESVRQMETKYKGVEFWFRGQNRDYRLPGRMVLARKGLAPIRSALDSSLVPSTYRSLDRYTRLVDYCHFISEVGEWLNAAESVLGPTHRWRTTGEDPDPELFPGVPDMRPSTSWRIEREDGSVATLFHDFFPSGDQLRKGLMLQHYGFPSPWLDITHDAEIALWFAVQKCTSVSGQYLFEPVSWDNRLEDMPVVYVFALMKHKHPYLNSEEILAGVNATRVERQKCGILGGAGNLARNYAARFIAMKIRLANKVEIREDISAEYLFPNDHEDLVLFSLLRRERLSKHPTIFPVTRV